MKNNRRDYDNPNYTPQGAHGQPSAPDGQSAAAGANGADPYAPCKNPVTPAALAFQCTDRSPRWWLSSVRGLVVRCYGPTTRWRPAAEHAQATRFLIPAAHLGVRLGPSMTQLMCLNLPSMGEQPWFHRHAVSFAFFVLCFLPYRCPRPMRYPYPEWWPPLANDSARRIRLFDGVQAFGGAGEKGLSKV